MELVKVEQNNLIINDETLKKIRDLYAFKAEFDVRMDELKNKVLEAMEANNIKSFENDFMKITYKPAGTRKTVDTQALKEQGLYEPFLKETDVKSSVLVTFK